MNHIRRIRRIAGVLAGLACAWLGLAAAAPLSPWSRSRARLPADQQALLRHLPSPP